MTPTLWLASNSPRRRALLTLAGWTFTVHPVDIDETPLPGEAAADYVLRLAESKARAAGLFTGKQDVVLAADTTVADGERILGKPSNAQEAREMLSLLRGREHTVYTAISAAKFSAGEQISDLCATRVWMRHYTDAEMELYIASGDPFDKAGAYAIQHPGFQPVERIEGCYASVVGLPVCRVERALAALGLAQPRTMTAACPGALAADVPCDIYEELLRREAAGS